MKNADLMVQPVKDTGNPATVPWDVTIWPKRSANKPGVDHTEAPTQSRLELFEETILPHLKRGT